MAENLVAYCGLYCGDCFNYKGEIADLARDLRERLRKAKFDRVSQGLSKYFKEFKNYGFCYEVLGAMVRLRCKRTCRNGCLLYTSPSPRDLSTSRMPSSA